MKNFESNLEQAARWVREHQERFWAITATSILVILFLVLFARHRVKAGEDAWNALGVIQSQINDSKFAEAQKSLQDWEAQYRTTNAAGYAKFLKADLTYRTSDYVQAGKIYGELAQTGNPTVMRPLALSAQIASLEMNGQWKEAQSLAASFLEKNPDHFLSASMYLTQARLLELTSDPAGAARIYERFALLYPQSPWTTLAKTKAQGLQKTPTIKTP